MTQEKSTTRKRRSQVLEPSKTAKPVAKKPRKLPVQPARLVNNEAPTARLNVYVFGEGSTGELGLGTQDATDVTRPRLNVKLDASKMGVVDIAAGGMHAVALTHDGKVLTWGVNDNNALGRETSWEGGVRDINNEQDDAVSDDSNGDLNPFESTPTAIPMQSFGPGSKIVSVTAGDSASFALTKQGYVYGWGTFVVSESLPLSITQIN
jgi:regulator of chromosome condensation